MKGKAQAQWPKELGLHLDALQVTVLGEKQRQDDLFEDQVLLLTFFFKASFPMAH